MNWPLRIVVLLLLGFVAMPAVVACIVAFDARAILNFPPQAWSLRWFERAFSYPDFREGAWNSLVVMAISSVLATIVGAGAALALEKGRFTGKRWLEGLVLAPLVVPLVLARYSGRPGHSTSGAPVFTRSK